ncbi:MAG TPA: type II CAAX endopeptidase family protein [Phycisphaerae bacterium]|nr:type II CAAX endopeptidase family protein [Phycisphaerae bacterium]
MPEQPPLPAEPDKIVLARPVQALPYAAVPPKPPGPIDLSGVRRDHAYLDLVLILTVAVIVPFAPHVVASFVFEDAGPPQIGPLTTAIKWIDVLLVGSIAAYLLLRHRLPSASFGLRSNGLGLQVLWSLGALIAAYAYIAGSVVVIFTVIAFVPGLQKDLLHRVDFVQQMPVTSLIDSILLLIPVAIHEELLFRGMLLPYLRRVVGRWWLAILISSAIFGGLHFPQGWLGALQITGLGAVLAICFVLSRSLLAVTIAHFAFNLLQFQIVRLLPDMQDLLQNG